MDIFPSHIRAYIFLLFAFGLALIFQYVFLRRQIFSAKWVILWAGITGAAFVSTNIWVVFSIVVVTSIFIMPKKSNDRIPYYFALLPVLPAFAYEIPSLVPGIRYLFNLTYPRMLVLLILLPMFLRYIQRPRSHRNKLLSSQLDKLVVFYVLFLSILAFRATSLTGGLRIDFILLLDIFLPYFVISRYVNSMEDINQVCIAILFSAIILVFVGLLEVKFRWGFYARLRDLLDFVPSRTATHLDTRGGHIRIEATMSSIPFSYFLAIGLGIFLYIKDLFSIGKTSSIATIGLISLALYFTGSRGGWLAAIIVIVVYSFFRIRSPQKRLALMFLGAFAVFGFLFTGSTPTYQDDTGTFEYRTQLFYNSLAVISKHPIVGTVDPNEGGALEVMRQGQGIIDIVNTYIQVALYSGIVGLLLFSSIFLVLLRQLYKKYALARRQSKEQEYLTGALLIALLTATMVLIGTVSSISYIPIYYWSLIALGSAYTRILSTKTR